MELDLDLTAERFPYLGATSPGLEINAVRLVLVPDLETPIGGVQLESAGVAVGEAQGLTPNAAILGGLPTTRWGDLTEAPGAFKVKIADGQIPEAHREEYTIDGITYRRFKAGSVRDLLVIVHFTV
ncbi:hypothetical protein [Nannocystis bainbridge]|uniref:Uncharacterized protein n=1 Tax=Nannocystis bainbridge TaxID=2995303 RepID=A0ABT5DTM5_9BACT|nr:hypothetical protein [Nannocystis bainbridge]MDC0716944.1 hypothetical protein [Nannocystis bainbridge]